MELQLEAFEHFLISTHTQNLIDDYPNIEDIRSQISNTTPGYPIVTLK